MNAPIHAAPYGVSGGADTGYTLTGSAPAYHTDVEKVPEYAFSSTVNSLNIFPLHADTVWWEQIGNSLRLLSRITETLRDCRSCVLHLPRELPWRTCFYSLIDQRRTPFSMDRRLKRLAWKRPKSEDPGEFITKNLCPEKVYTEYWPGISYAEYLGSRRDLALCDYYVWVTGIRRKNDLVRWTEFVSRYAECVGDPETGAVFILEYEGPDCRTDPVEQISYQVENYDCRVFCLEAAALVPMNPVMRGYHAEVAQCLGGNSPELCAALLRTGEPLLEDPLRVTREVLSSARHTSGEPFPTMSEEEIYSAVWRAGVVVLFPILERVRFNFISRHERELMAYLPLPSPNPYAEPISEPFELEIGEVCYIASNAHKFSSEEVDQLFLCRKVRNFLAHNKPVACKYVRQLMSIS